MPLHKQATWELSYVVLGHGERLIGENRSDFSDGDLVLIPPGMRHCWYFNPDYTNADGNIVNISIMINESIISGLKNLFPELSMHIERLLKSLSALTFDEDTNRRISGLMMDMRPMDELHQSKTIIDSSF